LPALHAPIDREIFDKEQALKEIYQDFGEV
jgi:hypothetical protein